VDGEPGVDVAAGRVDVERDVVVGVVGLEVQELGVDAARDGVVHGAREEDDPLCEET
jgi:hypothetical protein